MRARYTIGHRVYSPGVEDDLGNVTPGYLPAVDLLVYGLAPTSSDEPVAPSRTAVVTGLAIYLPGGPALGPHDRYVVDGAEWEQDGEVADYTRGPFSNRVGQRVLNLKRVEG